jgi:hypothetical protein
MGDMSSIGKMLIFLGIILMGIGVVFFLANKIPWIGRLPGDVYVKRGNLSFYFPIATCILISIIISAIFWLLGRPR